MENSFRLITSILYMEHREISSKLDIQIKYYDDEAIARISGFCRSAEMNFHHLAEPRNVSVDLKYNVLCLRVFV